MKKIIAIVLTAVVSLSFLGGSAVQAATLAQTYSGRIVIDAQNVGRAWYVNPANHLRYPLVSAADVSYIISKLGVGISEANFQKLATAGMTAKGDLVLARQLSGKIIIEVAGSGAAWYVNPLDLKKHPLGSGAQALSDLLKFGVIISHDNLAKIPRAFKDDSANNFSSFKSGQKVLISSGTFYVDIAQIGLGKLTPKIITDTAGVENCSASCPTKPLGEYITNQQAFAAINGVYGLPFYNSRSKVMVNQSKLNSYQPVIAFDENNKFYYFSAGNKFSAKNFLTTYGANLSAAFTGRAKLVENGKIKPVAASVRTVRNAFGFKQSGANPQGTVFLVSARSATLAELAKIMKALGADYAVSLDGGAYRAFYYNDEYTVGPFSNVPNAILFVAK
jgi:hypothetical protein